MKKKFGKLRSESSTPISVRQQTLLIKRLCDRGSSEPKEPKHKRNMKGETSLHRAAMAGDAELLRKLLPEYTDVDIQDYAGWTPLLEACNRGRLECAELLLSVGARVSFRGPSGVTPLHDACYNGHAALARLLVSSGGDLDARDDNGTTPREIIAQKPVLRIELYEFVQNIDKTMLTPEKSQTPENDQIKIEKDLQTLFPIINEEKIQENSKNEETIKEDVFNTKINEENVLKQNYILEATKSLIEKENIDEESENKFYKEYAKYNTENISEGEKNKNLIEKTDENKIDINKEIKKENNVENQQENDSKAEKLENIHEKIVNKENIENGKEIAHNLEQIENSAKYSIKINPEKNEVFKMLENIDPNNHELSTLKYLKDKLKLFVKRTKEIKFDEFLLNEEMEYEIEKQIEKIRKNSQKLIDLDFNKMLSEKSSKHSESNPICSECIPPYFSHDNLLKFFWNEFINRKVLGDVLFEDLCTIFIPSSDSTEVDNPNDIFSRMRFIKKKNIMLIFRDRYISLFSDLAKVDAPKDEIFFDNLKTNTSKLVGDFKKLQKFQAWQFPIN